MEGIGQYGFKIYKPPFPNGATVDNQAATPKYVNDALGGAGGGKYIPFVSANYISVYASGDASSNGTKLLAALTAAYALTPNGAALSATNRACVLLFPGVYDIANYFLEINKFVDIKCFGDADDIIIKGRNSFGTFYIHTDADYSISNCSISNYGGYNSITIQTVDLGKWNNLILLSTTSIDVTYSGTYSNLVCNSDYVLCGDITGTVEYCTFQNYSCCYSEANAGTTITMSGIVRYCTGIDNCFASTALFDNTNVSISGTFYMNTGEQFCFGQGNAVTLTSTGAIGYCTAGRNSFITSASGGTLNFNAGSLIEYCTCTTFNAFGRTDGDINMDGIVRRCEIVSGGGFAYSVGGAVTTSSTAQFIDCTGLSSCFGISTGGTESNSARFINCSGNDNCFGTSTTTAYYENCNRTQGYGTHAGTFQSCRFTASLADSLVLDNGANVRYCTITNTGAFFTINGNGAIAANIYHNSLNNAYNAVNVTNNINPLVEYNTVDPNVTY